MQTYKQFRDIYGLTQKELSTMLGTTPESISMSEIKGKTLLPRQVFPLALVAKACRACKTQTGRMAWIEKQITEI